MDAHLLSNALAYCAQVAALAVLGTAVAFLIRIDAPRISYLYWRVLVALCLLLPWMQGRTPAVLPAADIAAASATVATVTVVSSQARIAPILDVTSALLIIVAMGAALRLLWLGVGIARLRRLRRAGTPAALDGMDDLRCLIGADAEVRLVPDLDQPLTFGIWRPVILLPERLIEQPQSIQRAVLAHELLHVQRRDWAWLLGEELLRAAFWFHPAIWWLIARVQLAREEVVDALAVAVLGSRRPYIEALMAFADETPLAPAPAFARRHHLFRRILLVSKEAAMSPRRIAFMALLTAFIVSAGTFYVVRAFPLIAAVEAAQAPAAAQQVKPITPENPIPRRLASVDPVYPPQFAGTGLVVIVSVQLTLDQAGSVADARSLSAVVPTGNPGSGTVDVEPFRLAALEAARRWQYAPPADPPIAFTAVFTFREGATASTQGGELRFSTNPQLTSTLERARALAQAAEANSAGQGRRGGPVPAPGTQAAPTPGARDGAATPGAVTPVTPAAPPAPGAPIRVGGAIGPPRQLSRVNPAYPPIAMDARVQGVVILELQVGGDGSVTDARVLRSIPLLDQAALDAVRQWRYEPTLLNGAPVPVIMTVTVQFTLPPPEPAN